MAHPRRLVVFDVNETLLDIDALEPLFDRIFANPGRMREWFAQLILYSQTLSMTGTYVPFGTLGGGILRMLGRIHDVAVTDDDVQALAAHIADLPVHADVADALHRLRDHGCAIVTLTNSSPGDAPDPLDRAGLGALFNRRFTVDPVRVFKPDPATYRMVGAAMGVAPDDTCLVAAHLWDTIGAQAFGWHGALVTRGVNAPLTLDGVAAPTIIAPDLTEVATAIVAMWPDTDA